MASDLATISRQAEVQRWARNGLLERVDVLLEDGKPVKAYRIAREYEPKYAPQPITDAMRERARYVVEHVFSSATVTADRWGEEVSLARTVSNIHSGELTDVVSVHAYDLTSGRCWDASREIAEAIASRAINSGEPLCWQAQGYVEHVLGVDGNELPQED